ncbi:unnamed protein product [Acanthoscelides obtectus]|nr:unnamed protein product [Acanthoscelides obtectus]CAK1682007.1 hypothetical protein AOBTE_LOCUS33372 [Acanthoscelides obtectus]
MDAGDIMKIEVGFQAVEADTKLFEVDNVSWKLHFKCNDNENIKHSVVERTAICLWITKEHNYAKAWIKSEADDELKVESWVDDSGKYPVVEISEEFIIKSECNNDDTLLSTNAGTVPNRSSSEYSDDNRQNFTPTEVDGKIRELTVKTERMDTEILKNMEYSSQNTDTHHFDEKAKAVLPFKRASNQDWMKQHPVVDKKTISESFFCHNCNYSARSKYLLISHMKEHNMCMCMSISSTIHKCSYCKYKTIHNSRPGKYMLKHPEYTCAYKTT